MDNGQWMMDVVQPMDVRTKHHRPTDTSLAGYNLSSESLSRIRGSNCIDSSPRRSDADRAAIVILGSP